MAIDDNASYELTGYQVKDLAQKIRAKADSASLASVATSGLYSDLTGAPTIPTVYNGTLTIQQNGTTVDTFTANSSTDKTVNIETITAETVAPAEEVGAITANMIDWSSFDYTGAANSGNVQIGPLLVQWGRSSVYVPSGSPGESASFTVTFPKAYAFAPVANIQPEDISSACGEYSVIFGTSTTNFTGTLGHALPADAGTRYFRWLAIGIANTN